MAMIEVKAGPFLCSFVNVVELICQGTLPTQFCVLT